MTLIHKTSTDQSVTQDSGNVFRVRWEDNKYPNTEDDTCNNGCTVVGQESCICETMIETAAVFTDMSHLPSSAGAVAELHIGSAPPDAFAAGVYAMCTSAECNAARLRGLTVFLHSSSGGTLDQRSIFFLYMNSTLGSPRSTYFANKASLVSMAGGRFVFRNPPKFHSFIRPSIRDAEHETNALIDHLFWHKNVAPFMATRLTQRFTSSNPSPRYVRTVVDAFRTGAHAGRTFSGAYGDLGAMFAAILLDREARSVTLDADPTHGQLREPLLKLFHVMRTFNYGNSKISHFHFDVSNVIGQHHMHSPTVFNFYDPLYQPEGPLSEVGLVAPEAELGTGPFVVGFLNTVATVIRGVWALGTIAGRWGADLDLTNTAAVVDELDLLLTGGRLNNHARSVIAAQYQSQLSTSTSEALKAAQELFLFTAEFHSTNLLQRREVPRPAIPDIPSRGRAYKAIVYIFLDGGADTYNLLVPTSGCTGGEGTDLWAQWESQRGDNVIPASSLLKISADTREQPCRSPTPTLLAILASGLGPAATPASCHP